MRIEAVRLHRVRIPFRGRFGHARSERAHGDAVFVELRDERGGVGWGEILPRPYVTGETLDGVWAQRGPALARRVLGLALPDRAAVEAWIRGQYPAAAQGRDLAAFGGFELALLDLAGRRHGFSLADVLGGTPGPALPPGVIIGFEIDTADLRKHCMALRFRGHTHVKVKVGRDDDVERLVAIGRVLGPAVPLRLDANMEWTVDEAVERLRAIVAAGVSLASIEQPVPADDLAGMRAIRERTTIAVMADEAVCSLADADAIVAAGAADVFNVRVGKHGGVLASLALVERASAAGIAIHLGTMVGESGVLSRVAEVFGRCVSGFACLDGKGQNRFLLEEDVLAGPIDSDDNPAATAPLHAPGLGVDVDPEIIARRRLAEPWELRAAG